MESIGNPGIIHALLSADRAEDTPSHPTSARVCRLIVCLWLCGFLPLTGFPAQTLTSPYTIFGRVFQPNNSPAVGAVVKLTDQIGMNRQVYTDDSGRFEIRDVPRGRYYLTAVNPSAPDQVADLVMVDLTLWAGKFAEANVYLRIRGMKDPSDGRMQKVVSIGEEGQKVPKKARRDFEQAVKLRNSGRYRESLAQFGRAIEGFQTYFQAFAARGDLFLTLQRLPEAVADFRRALELNPLYGPALRGAAKCDFQQRRYTEAIRGFERAAEAEPGNASNHYFMGVAGVALDRREQARAALQRALALDPVGSARAHVHLAILMIRDGRPEDAIREIETYLQDVPEPPDVEKLHTLLTQLRAAAVR